MSIYARRRLIANHRFGNYLPVGLSFLFLMLFVSVFMSRRSLSASVRTLPSIEAQIQSRDSNSAQKQIPAACVPNPVVVNTNDSGAGSLRDAINTACSGG
ncbi:MAG TPA: hypothetical protein VHP99_01665, partial [Pyrinomonadaceae bacterium]|nr:hypothetical protein [Pyrinomonadaceae bacterium]